MVCLFHILSFIHFLSIIYADFLIDTGGKLDDAERMGIEIWNEDDFDNALNGISPV